MCILTLRSIVDIMTPPDTRCPNQSCKQWLCVIRAARPCPTLPFVLCALLFVDRLQLQCHFLRSTVVLCYESLCLPHHEMLLRKQERQEGRDHHPVAKGTCFPNVVHLRSKRDIINSMEPDQSWPQKVGSEYRNRSNQTPVSNWFVSKAC